MVADMQADVDNMAQQTQQYQKDLQQAYVAESALAQELEKTRYQESALLQQAQLMQANHAQALAQAQQQIQATSGGPV